MTTNIKKQIGQDLRRRRLIYGLTQQALADLFNASGTDGLTTSRTDIVKYEAGTATIPGDKYVKFMNLIP